MGLFNKNQGATVQLTQRQMLENTVKVSRNNLLLVLAFTIINILLLVTDGNTYFLFSAYAPYMLVDYGMFYGGMYPTEYYGEFLSEISFLGKGFFGVMMAIAAVVLILYALCWVFAKKNPKGWLIFALVLFGIDTAMLLLMAGIAVDLLVDYLFHGWVIVSFAKGLSALKKLKELPEETEPTFVEEEVIAEEAPEAVTVEE